MTGRRLCAIAALLSLLLGGCSRSEAPSAPDEETPPTPEAGDGLAAADDQLVEDVTVGDWTNYAPPPEDWPTQPLNIQRWALATAELACAGRANHGDPDALVAASRRILHHHQTTAEAVMSFGVQVNEDSERALRLGEVVAAATERCR